MPNQQEDILLTCTITSSLLKNGVTSVKVIFKYETPYFMAYLVDMAVTLRNRSLRPDTNTTLHTNTKNDLCVTLLLYHVAKLCNGGHKPKDRQAVINISASKHIRVAFRILPEAKKNERCDFSLTLQHSSHRPTFN
jgi:hypothetical protein